MSYPQGGGSDRFVDGSPSRHADRMARADGCPTACGNYQPPYAVEDGPEDVPAGFVAHYACGTCGHRWYTSWEDC